MNPTRFTVSIVCYLALEEAKRCIHSVHENSTQMPELILTANGNQAAADYFNSVRRAYPGVVRVFENDRNEGFVKPTNMAASFCKTEFFVTLNDDTYAPEGWLEALVKPFEEHPKAAIVGVKGTGCTLKANLDGYAGKRLDYIEMSCAMFRTSVIKEHGLIPGFIDFAYGCDVATSLKYRELGYSIHQVALPGFYHAGKTTSRQVPGVWEIRKQNHREIRKRYGNYLRTGNFDPISAPIT